MKVLMLFVLCLAFLSVHAQNNNLGFENWSNGLVFTPVPKESPIPGAGDCHPYLSGNAELLSSSGMIPNDQILPGWSAMQFGIMRTPDAHSGKYAAVVCMWYNGSRGVMAIGQSENVAQAVPKISLAKKLYGVSGFYKYKVDSLAPNDTYKKNTMLHIASYKTNPVSGALEEIQHDSVTFAKAGTYTEFYLPVVYADTTLIADSVSIWFESKGYNSGTTSCGLSHFLYLDDLQLHYQPYTLHILETGQNKKIEVYPNPVKLVLNLQYANNITVRSIKLTDVSGRMVRKFHEDDLALNLTGLPDGSYHLNIEGSFGKVTEKVIIQTP